MNLLWADDVSWSVVVVLWPFVTVVAVDRIAVGVPIISLPFALHFTYEGRNNNNNNEDPARVISPRIRIYLMAQRHRERQARTGSDLWPLCFLSLVEYQVKEYSPPVVNGRVEME